MLQTQFFEEWQDGVDGFIKVQGAVAGIQLAHAGRKASSDYPWRGTKASTAQAFGLHLSKVPREMNVSEIETLIDDFVGAAKRAILTGAEVIEIHAGHGYLLHEFLSPLTNRRTDEYGGAFESRTRLLLQIAQRVRHAWPAHLQLFARLSTTDWVEGGWSLEDSLRLSQKLQDLGVDLIDSSSGFVAPSPTPYPVAPLWQVDLSAAANKSEIGIPTGAVGFITKAIEAETIIRDKKADLVFLGREYLRQPHWPMLAAKDLGVDVMTVGAPNIAHWIK